MERSEKGVEREGKSGRRLMVEKLKGVLVGKKGGPSTPPPTWRLELPSQHNGSDIHKEFLSFPSSTVSARKLCANLWEIQPHQQRTPLAKMNKPNTTLLRRRGRLRRHVHHHKDTVSDVHNQLAEPPDTPSDQAASPSSLKKHVVASPVQHHRSVERKGCAPQPVSPACYSSSVEVAPYKGPETPTSSLGFKGKIRESSYSLKTSADLLNVLNHIWSLEEQHSSNISAVKALKVELDHSRTRMKELLREKQTNRQEMENFMKQMTVDKLVRRNIEHDRIKAAIQPVKEELENERRLRKHSESLHRKLARELSEVKSSFSGCLRNLERERKARILLENLCDEFAKGVRDYEQEVHFLRRNSEKGQVNGNNSLDRLILHISEAWLDERMQMKQAQSGSDLIERNSIVDKLGFDIETFLHAKRSVDLKKYGYASPKELKEIHPCQHSMDSLPLKELGSAPHNMLHEDSIDTNILEPNMATDEGLHKLSSKLQSKNNTEVHQEKARKLVISKEIRDDSQFQANLDSKMSCDDNEICFVNRKSSEITEHNIAPLNDEAKQDPQENNRPCIQKMMRRQNSSLSSEGDKIYPETICKGDFCVRSSVTGNGTSPVKLQKSKLKLSDFDKWESSEKLPKGVKENTLMAKLLEARYERQKSRSRTSKSIS